MVTSGTSSMAWSSKVPPSAAPSRASDATTRAPVGAARSTRSATASTPKYGRVSSERAHPAMTRSAEELAHIALEVATEAAQLLHAGFRRHPAVREKGRADLVTEYDLASERLIRKLLGERTPEIPIVAEEQGGTPATAGGLTWYCDPLDGTTNFVHGHFFYCVSIGAGQAGEAVAGAVVAPELATHWQGFRGGPALRN